MDREVCSLILKRWEVVDSLRRGAKDKRTLVDSLDCSRSTVDRAVRELESIGIVEYVDGEYVVTSLGESITEGFENVMATVELQVELEPFLQWLPEDALDLELRHLQDAEVLVPKAGDPYAMINRHVTVLSEADVIRCVLPVVGLHPYEAAYEQVVENGARCELVVTPEVAKVLQTDPAYAGLTEEMAATGQYELLRYDGSLPYFVGLFDDIVQIGVDDKGEPRAMVESENPVVQKWAQNTVVEYKDQAELVMTTAEAAKAQL